MEDPAAEPAGVAETFAETAHLLNIHLKEKLNMVAFPNLPLTKLGIKPLNTKILLMIYPSYTQTRTSDISMIHFVCETIYRMRPYRPIWTQHYLWPDTYNVEIKTVDPDTVLDITTGECPIIIPLVQKTHFLAQIFRNNYYC